MTDAAELASEIATRLGPVVHPNLTAKDRVDDLYEAYIFTLVLWAARLEGFSIGYESILPGSPGAFVFRTGPGHIYTTTLPYSYAVVTAENGISLEVHVGIYALGRSRVSHECDVVILRRDEAVACRVIRVDPLHTQAELAVECKFYAASLPLGLLRGFVGLSADLAKPWSALASNVSSPSMAQLFKAHHRNWEDHLTPGTPAEERFVGIVRSLLHRVQSL